MEHSDTAGGETRAAVIQIEEQDAEILLWLIFVKLIEIPHTPIRLI